VIRVVDALADTWKVINHLIGVALLAGARVVFGDDP